MSNKILPVALMCLSALPTLAQDLPPGLNSARLLPGWTDEQGNRIAALELDMQPGWKTYWRNPGDSGLPPHFDWQGSENLGDVTFHWPAPEAITSGDEVTLGYHDRLILPFTVTPAKAGQPIDLQATVDLGLCERICVPAHLDLTAMAAAKEPDPRITAALDSQPQKGDGPVSCRAEPIEDGVRLRVDLSGRAARVAAMELVGQPEVWVSLAEISDGAAVSDFVPPSGKPFDLRTDQVRITLIGDSGAEELTGCQSAS